MNLAVCEEFNMRIWAIKYSDTMRVELIISKNLCNIDQTESITKPG